MLKLQTPYIVVFQMLCYTAYSVRTDCCRWTGTSALIPSCCFVSRWNVCRWNGTSAFSLWTMLFCFRVKWLQVKWYICFQSLNYAVLFLGEMIAGEMVHLLSVSELCCFVLGWNDCRWSGTSAFSLWTMLFCFWVKWLQVKWYICFQSLYAVSCRFCLQVK